MTQGKAILVIDLGNSSTKGKVLYGKKDGKYREKSFEIPNTFGTILDDEIEPTDNYDSETSTVFKIKTEGLADTKGFTTEVVGTYANGEYQTNEYSASVMRPVTLSKKAVQPVVVLSCYMAIWNGFKAVARLAGVGVDDVYVDWTIVALLPPQDIKEYSGNLEKMFRSIKTIDTIFPECKKEVNIDKIKILPEGYCAFIGTVFETGMEIRPDYKALLNKNVLVLDVGEGTTDFVIMAKNKLQNSTLKTVMFGGKNVRSRLKALVGVDVSDEAYKNALLTGELPVGEGMQDICEEINNAKKFIASKIYTNLYEHLEGNGIQPDSIYGILIVGGGVLEGDNPNIKPLSEYIMEQFKQFFPAAKLIELPKHTVTKIVDDEPVKVEETISPRMLNIMGASVLAEAIAKSN